MSPGERLIDTDDSDSAEIECLEINVEEGKGPVRKKLCGCCDAMVITSTIVREVRGDESFDALMEWKSARA